MLPVPKIAREGSDLGQEIDHVGVVAGPDDVLLLLLAHGTLHANGRHEGVFHVSRRLPAHGSVEAEAGILDPSLQHPLGVLVDEPFRRLVRIQVPVLVEGVDHLQVPAAAPTRPLAVLVDHEVPGRRITPHDAVIDDAVSLGMPLPGILQSHHHQVDVLAESVARRGRLQGLNLQHLLHGVVVGALRDQECKVQRDRLAGCQQVLRIEVGIPRRKLHVAFQHTDIGHVHLQRLAAVKLADTGRVIVGGYDPQGKSSIAIEVAQLRGAIEPAEVVYRLVSLNRDAISEMRPFIWARKPPADLSPQVAFFTCRIAALHLQLGRADFLFPGPLQRVVSAGGGLRVRRNAVDSLPPRDRTEQKRSKARACRLTGQAGPLAVLRTTEHPQPPLAVFPSPLQLGAPGLDGGLLRR